ncbi:MAG: CopG family transcriptional regulator [Corynebacterium pyruviciproducens]|uniref:CopG family transcriptional regulator n=1 Tax=Corynebacterium pyruviciproducens TaxID=598660 RepID=UPI003983B3B3
MTLRLTPTEERALTLLADSWGVSKADAARRAILTSTARLLKDDEMRAAAREELERRGF